MDGEIELRLFFWIGTVMMLMLAVALILLSTVYHKRLYQMRQKESQKLLQATVESEQKERQRIAADIHDGVLGELTATFNLLDALSTFCIQEKEKGILGEAGSMISRATESLRMIAYNIMPPSFISNGLVGELKAYFERCRKWSKISITDQYEIIGMEVSSTAAYNIYRIVQEVIMNIVRHGNATMVNFQLVEMGSAIHVSIEDDSSPFDFLKAVQTSKGIGVQSILSRLKYLEGQLQQIVQDQGNEIKFTFKNAV